MNFCHKVAISNTCFAVKPLLRKDLIVVSNPRFESLSPFYTELINSVNTLRSYADPSTGNEYAPIENFGGFVNVQTPQNVKESSSNNILPVYSSAETPTGPFKIGDQSVNQYLSVASFQDLESDGDKKTEPLTGIKISGPVLQNPLKQF